MQRDERFTVMFSKVAVLNMAVKNEAGAWDWQNRGKGQMSVRKDTQTGKFYIFFNSEGVSVCCEGLCLSGSAMLVCWVLGAGRQLVSGGVSDCVQALDSQ